MASNLRQRTPKYPRDRLYIKKIKRISRSPEGSLGIRICMRISYKTSMNQTLQIKFRKKIMSTLTQSILLMTYLWPIKSAMIWKLEGKRERRSVRNYSRKCLMLRDESKTKSAFKDRLPLFNCTKKMSTLSELSSRTTLLMCSIMIFLKRKRQSST
jgi:hypothetical protein